MAIGQKSDLYANHYMIVASKCFFNISAESALIYQNLQVCSCSLTTSITMDTLPVTRNRHSSSSLEMICPSLFHGSLYVDRSRGRKQNLTAQCSPVSVFTTPLAFNISEKLHSITKLYNHMSAKRSDRL